MKTTSKKKNIRGLGALLSQPDSRRIMIAKVQSYVKRPSRFYFDDSDVPTENQLALGSCVGQAEGGHTECREKMDTGKVTPVSKRWVYSQSKKLDGFAGEGTFPSIAAGILVKRGAPKKDFCPDDNSLPHAEYIKVPEDSLELQDDAGLRVAEGYAYVPVVLEEILQTIFQKKTYTATMQVGNWSTMPVKPTPSRGNHRIRINGYREIDGGKDALIWYRNSWGNSWAKVSNKIKLNSDEKKKVARGDGFFLFSEYEKYLFEQIAYTDIPYALILEARNKKYVFLRNLKYKMSGTDVMELQKRLAKEPAKDKMPCYRYPNAAGQTYSTYFDIDTRDAVKRYQEKNSLKADGIVGPKTRGKLNAVAGIAAPLAAVKQKIILNAGHHNADPGATTSKYKEADETKKIRDAATVALRSVGFEVYEIPDSLTLPKSIADANKQAPELNDAFCLDIHLNFLSDKNARGTEAFYGTSDTSKKIAEVMAEKVAESLNLTNRGAKSQAVSNPGKLAWIRETKAWASLVEVCFISNDGDMAALKGSNGYKKAGEGIANAVMALYGISAPVPVKPGLPEAKKLIQEGLDILKTL